MAEPVDIAALGDQLKRVRKARGGTLQTVAEQIDVSIATLSRIERGDAKSVDGTTLLAITKWMGTPAQEFQERPDVPSGKPTPDVVELHLRADRNLDKRAALALAKMFRVAYEFASERHASKRRG